MNFLCYTTKITCHRRLWNALLAPAAAYTVGRAIIQNYEFTGIRFCLFRWFAVRPTFNSFCGLSVCRGHRSRISGLPKRKPSKRLLRPLPICLDIYFIFNMSLCDCANRTVGMLIRSFPLRQTQNRSDGVPDKTTARRNELRTHLFAN